MKKLSHISLFFFLFLYLFRCVCNIDCSQTNFNPLCASDGKSYDNACQIKEASCQKQEKIEVMSLGRCQGNSHNKTHFKECFQFLFGEKKKEPGLASYLALLTFPLDSCNLYCRAQAAGGSRALHSTDTKRGARSGAHNPSHTLPTVAGDCPALHWFQNQAPVLCPEQLAQSSALWVGAGAGQQESPTDTSCHPGWILCCSLTGAARSNLRRPKTCSQTQCWCLFLTCPALGP